MANKKVEVQTLLARKEKALRREKRMIGGLLAAMVVLTTLLTVIGIANGNTYSVLGAVVAGLVYTFSFTLISIMVAARVASGKLSKRLLKTQTVEVDGTEVYFDHADAWQLCDDEKVPAAFRDTLRESLLLLDKQIVVFSNYVALWPDVSIDIVYNTVRCYHTVLNVKKAQHEADMQERYALDAERSDNLVEQVNALAREVEAKMLH